MEHSRPNIRWFPTLAASLENRRAFLMQALGGYGVLGLARTLASAHASSAKIPAKARRILLLFLSAGMSQVDTFDYKSELARRHGQALAPPGQLPDVFFRAPGKLMQSPFRFQRYGESGKWVSELFPHLARQVDTMTFVHSMVARENSHGPAMLDILTGQARNGAPSLGAWMTYGLGTENENLPAFVVLLDRGMPPGTTNCWGHGYLPGQWQGTVLSSQQEPIKDLFPPAYYSRESDKASYSLLAEINREHRAARPGQPALSARIAAAELAARMQAAAPEAVDLRRETPATLELYGVERPVREQATFARLCLLARRLLERGTRVVALFCGGSNNNSGQWNWDAHDNLEKNHRHNALIADQPIAALLTDLRARGLLKDTLVICTGEFGRTPTSEGSLGRDHNISGFTLWLAGAGVKPGFSYGSTDEWGFRAVENPVAVADLHATILRLMGLDHEQLTYFHQGQHQRLTGVNGKVVTDILA